jgi:hypothetical protein
VKEGVLRIFIVLKNLLPCPGLNPQTLGSSGKHTNHYMTEATEGKCLLKYNQSDPVILQTHEPFVLILRVR